MILFFSYQGDIEDDDMENETGILPVQLPFSHIALKAKEKQAESASMEADIKGLYIISCSQGDIQINYPQDGNEAQLLYPPKHSIGSDLGQKKVLLTIDQLLSKTSL